MAWHKTFADAAGCPEKGAQILVQYQKTENGKPEPTIWLAGLLIH